MIMKKEKGKMYNDGRTKKMNELENIMYNVAWLRTHFGLSQKRMAELLRISIYSISKIENGIFPPRLCVDVIFNISDHFGIRPIDLVSRKLSGEDIVHSKIVF